MHKPHLLTLGRPLSGVTAMSSHLYKPSALHQPLPGPNAIGPAELDLFQRQGFLAVADVLTGAEVASAQSALSGLIAGTSPKFDGIQYESEEWASRPMPQREGGVRKLIGFVEHESRLRAIAEKPAFLAIVETILGARVRLTQDMALLKPAHVGREKPWHQDTAYFLLEPAELVLGTWIALDRATVENGCMHVIPGSHRLGPRPHYHDRDCQIPDQDVAVNRVVAIPLEPGGALFFSGLLHHGTPPNRSSDRRRALQFHYAAETCQVVTAHEHALRFFDRRGPAGCIGHLTGQPDRPIAQKSE